ncbi:uncharacterized protein LOC120186262 [Hibiscus syriacus]|uniref:uncharacterized protein LOC120186262 n=1 Tax=Hibiscus syriacus TaxID=106335 RepID=UPI0019227625|nr:uncharacterized protein LOC120186262 [Hibiscus syriacus]
MRKKIHPRQSWARHILLGFFFELGKIHDFTTLGRNSICHAFSLTKNSEMQGDEARLLLGFPPDSRPTPSQIKAAYRKKVWESHPDLFPVHQKPSAESKFKLIAEAYACLQSATYSHVVRMRVPKAHGGRKNRALIQIPFLLIVLGSVGLGGLNATRAYRKQKEACPSHNPFLP